MIAGIFANIFRQALQRNGHLAEFEAAILSAGTIIILMLLAWYAFFLVIRFVKWAWTHA